MKTKSIHYRAPIFLLVALFFCICDNSHADDMFRTTGFKMTASGWSRAMKSEELELKGWVFYNCRNNRYENADTRFIIFQRFKEVAGNAERDEYLRVFNKLYHEEYPGAQFEKINVSGTWIDLGYFNDEDGDIIFTTNLPVGNRIWNIVGTWIGGSLTIPAHVRDFFQSIQKMDNGPITVRPSDPLEKFKAGELMSVAACFREQAAVGFVKTLTDFEAENAFMFMLDKPVYQNNSDAWTRFFDGCYLLAGNPHQQKPVTAFYHPLYDAAVLVKWKHLNNGGVGVDDATLVTGNWRTAVDNGFHVPRWITAENDTNGALKNQISQFIMRFEMAYPPKSTGKSALPGRPSPELVASVFGQCRLQLETLLAFYSPELKDMRTCLNSFRLSLITGQSHELTRRIPAENAIHGKELTGLPLQFRSDLDPIYIMAAGGQITVILGHDSFPGFYLFVCISKGTVPKIASVGITTPGDVTGGLQ